MNGKQGKEENEEVNAEKNRSQPLIQFKEKTLQPFVVLPIIFKKSFSRSLNSQAF